MKKYIPYLILILFVIVFQFNHIFETNTRTKILPAVSWANLNCPTDNPKVAKQSLSYASLEFTLKNSPRLNYGEAKNSGVIPSVNGYINNREKDKFKSSGMQKSRLKTADFAEGGLPHFPKFGFNN